MDETLLTNLFFSHCNLLFVLLLLTLLGIWCYTGEYRRRSISAASSDEKKQISRMPKPGTVLFTMLLVLVLLTQIAISYQLSSLDERVSRLSEQVDRLYLKVGYYLSNESADFPADSLNESQDTP